MSRFKEKSDRGFGDTVARFTKVTKIDKVVKAVTASVGIEDCGCTGRQERLNKIIPYKTEES